MEIYDLWTDASVWQPKLGYGIGGVAAIIISPQGEKTIIIAKDPLTSNCRAELLAVVLGVQAIPLYSMIRLFTDSSYVIKLIKGAHIKVNKDLAKILRVFLRNRLCIPEYVKGHSHFALNNEADKLAKYAREYGPLITEEFRFPVALQKTTIKG